MSTKSLRPRKSRQTDEMKQEIVAQVHKTIKKETANEIENANPTEDSSESNKTFIIDDRYEHSIKTPSREISVDEETQISSKILNLIEKEMKRDLNKHSHFTDSRPQSLSFYEDEKVPEELSGNLELLSPEERRHYKRRKDYIDIDQERNAYNSMQDTLNRENEDAILNGSAKKSKSRKKKHSQDPELGLGDSREMMIPKDREKRKSKKKKREYSPISSSSGKRKHRKNDEYEPRNDITLALDELQDDVFENGTEEFARPDRMKKSPRKSDKIYVQRKNRFEVTTRADASLTKVNMPGEDPLKQSCVQNPVHLAIVVQKIWIPFATLCHGLLGGLSIGHILYIYSVEWASQDLPLEAYSDVSSYYALAFYFLCVVCIISVCDRHDISHMDMTHLVDLFRCRKSCIVLPVYVLCLVIHLIAAITDDKIALYKYSNYTLNVTAEELTHWTKLSYWRSGLAALAWGVVALVPEDDLFYLHLKSMEVYVNPES